VRLGGWETAFGWGRDEVGGVSAIWPGNSQYLDNSLIQN
jgi:hypothetical protein